MAEKKKWENISSDEEEDDAPQQKEVQKVEEPVQKQEEEQEEEEQKQEQQPQRKYEKKKLPGKAEMIDEIKKIETDQVAINIFKLDEKATKDDIFKTFSNVDITSIFQNKHIKGSFILYFNEKQQAINFVRSAPRPIKDQQRFMMKVGKVYEKSNNSDWNEMGTGGRLVQTQKKPLLQGNKYYDKPKRNYQNYNRKEVNNVYGEDGGEKPFYKKNYKGGYKKNYNNNRNQEQQEEGAEEGEKQEYKPRFYKGGNKKDGNKTEQTGQSKEIFGDAKQRDETKFNKFEKEGFQKVETYNDKKKKKEPQTKKQEEQEDDGWEQAGQKTQQKIEKKKEEIEYQKEEKRKQNYQDKNQTKKGEPIKEKNTFNKLKE